MLYELRHYIPVEGKATVKPGGFRGRLDACKTMFVTGLERSLSPDAHVQFDCVLMPWNAFFSQPV
jgi:hypothetical protein